MLNTKLIFVDGITGSGKSTTAHFIARQLEKNGIKAKWFHEGETGNPLDQLSQNKDENDNDFAIRFMKEYPEERYEKFVSSIKDDDCIYIVDSFLFQDIIWIPLFYDISKEDIKKFVHKLCSIVDCLNPVVIHYYQSDIEKAMRENWLRRGDQWKDWLVGREELSPYCKNRNISGESGTIEFWKGISDLSREILEELSFPKIEIENSEHDWQNYRKQILNFLKLQIRDELLPDISIERFCGNYSGTIVHVKDNRLCVDAYYPNLKLIPNGHDEYEIEGFPITLKFIAGEDNLINSFKVSKALCYYKEGDVKLKCVELKTDELEMFCGDYLCESEKLARTIYLKDSKLYYWRAENNETELLPINQKKIAFGDGYFDFEFNDGEKKFVLSGPDRDDIVFVEVKKTI